MNTDFEEMRPEWAIGKAEGKLVIGAQLPTRDGRRIGNAHIVSTCQATWDEGVTLYEILTDAGNRTRFTASELDSCFYPPVWVSDVKDVMFNFESPPCIPFF